MSKGNLEKNGIIVKVILIVAGAMITVGGICTTIRFNTARIEKVEVIAAGNKGDIREIKTDLKYIISSVDEIKKEVKK